MKINADFAKPAAVASESLAWAPSPLPGVARRMLERDGDEVSRVTTVVRFGPQSRFSDHTHIGGEEYLVLDGTFSDQYGDFPAGTYVRNPIGSRHAPHSDDGATILVKLFWMHAEDQDYVRIDTTREDLWRAAARDGVEIMDLHQFDGVSEALYRLAPGAALPARDLPGGEEIFVLEGSLEGEDGSHGKGDWLRAPIGKAPRLGTKAGCRILVKRGHLLNPPPGPENI